MRLGIAIEGDPWNFFEDVYQDMRCHYDVDVFKRREVKSPIFYYRINQRLFHNDLDKFMKKNNVVFFEWASDLLSIASHRPKQCRIVTRLHRYEMFGKASTINWEVVDKIILVSHAMQQKFAERFPEHTHKTVVIPVGISTDKYRPNGKTFSGDIGTLCYLTPRKRVYDLILTFYELLQKKKDLHLHIGGGSHPRYGDYDDAMYSLVKKLGLQDHITFYGKITAAQMWYRKIDIFISNSYSEGLQVAPMEAMASGCYCLSHRWDGAEELLPEEYLFYTNAELQEKILSYCQMQSEIKRQEQAKMRAIACEKFKIELIKSKIRNIIEEMSHT